MKCKYMKDGEYTPSDYDLTFDVADIPSNIKSRGSLDLKKELQKVTPLTRRVHLNLRNHEEAVTSNATVSTGLTVNGVRII